jgi:hypothetical protein
MYENLAPCLTIILICRTMQDLSHTGNMGHETSPSLRDNLADISHDLDPPPSHREVITQPANPIVADLPDSLAADSVRHLSIGYTFLNQFHVFSHQPLLIFLFLMISLLHTALIGRGATTVQYVSSYYYNE